MQGEKQGEKKGKGGDEIDKSTKLNNNKLVKLEGWSGLRIENQSGPQILVSNK